MFKISAIGIRAGPGRVGPKIPSGRADSQKKQVSRKMIVKFVESTLNWLQNPSKLVKSPQVSVLPPQIDFKPHQKLFEFKILPGVRDGRDAPEIANTVLETRYVREAVVRDV